MEDIRLQIVNCNHQDTLAKSLVATDQLQHLISTHALQPEHASNSVMSMVPQELEAQLLYLINAMVVNYCVYSFSIVKYLPKWLFSAL